MAKCDIKKDNWIKKTLQGRVVSYKFFVKNWYIIAGVLLLLIIFISNKYLCQTQLEQIMALSKELNNAKTDRIRASSEYNSKIRETEMRDLIDTMGINLTMPEKPPYKIEDNEATK